MRIVDNHIFEKICIFFRFYLNAMLIFINRAIGCLVIQKVLTNHVVFRKLFVEVIHYLFEIDIQDLPICEVLLSPNIFSDFFVGPRESYNIHLWLFCVDS